MSAPAAIELDAQYRQLREECALLDRSRRGSIAVRGSEAAEYLQGQLTNEIEELRPGAGCYAALLDRKGHVQADMRVLRTATDEFLLDTEEEGLEAARRHLQTYNIGREAEVSDETAGRALLSLLGPRSAEVAGAVRGETHECEAVEVAAVECLAITTRDGLDLSCAAGRSGCPGGGPDRARRGRDRGAGGRDRPDRGRRAPLRRRDHSGDDAGRGGDRRARR